MLSYSVTFFCFPNISLDVSSVCLLWVMYTGLWVMYPVASVKGSNGLHMQTKKCEMFYPFRTLLEGCALLPSLASPISFPPPQCLIVSPSPD